MANLLEASVIRLLASNALAARSLSHCPYSRFAVGASLLCEGGKIYTGCNIESAAYSPSLCAERVALSKAVSEGHRRFRAIAIAGGPAGKDPAEYCYPCGVCRQSLGEFCEGNLAVILVKSADDVRLTTLEELFPFGFSAKDLER